MKMKHRNGTYVIHEDSQETILHFLYGTALGRFLLKPLILPPVSRLAGRFLSSRLSKPLIPLFIKQHSIDVSHFTKTEFDSYNDFFSRKIRPELRPVDKEPTHFISPCDCKLTVLPITANGIFTLKHTPYTISSLLRNRALAQEYLGGYAMIFRLTVDDYHRYCYVADGIPSTPVKIPGVFHTVNPIANDHFPIYKENVREYTILHTDTFGDLLLMEVGALLVGKIVNHPVTHPVKRGQEKGYFQFGGSTIVILAKKDVLQPDNDILENSARGIETIVRLGEKIARKKS